jgi:hypothetical protein
MTSPHPEQPVAREPFTPEEEAVVRQQAESGFTFGNERVRRILATLDAARASVALDGGLADDGLLTGMSAKRALDIIEDHWPEIGVDQSDETWLMCVCGWDSSTKGSPDWYQHLVDAVEEPAARLTDSSR